MPLTSAGKIQVMDGGLPSPLYIQLHVGAPGAAGTANQATETTRQSITVGAANTAGVRSNTNTGSWTAITVSASSETLSHFTAWTSASAGSFCVAQQQLTTSRIVQSGDTITFASSAFTFGLQDP